MNPGMLLHKLVTPPLPYRGPPPADVLPTSLRPEVVMAMLGYGGSSDLTELVKNPMKESGPDGLPLTLMTTSEQNILIS